jgi:hypothetical protein
MPDHTYFANLIWQIADLLRGPYRPPQYERVMLPMTVLRRFDCVLAPTKSKVLAEHERRRGGRLNDDALDRILNNAAGQRFHNHSPLDFEKLKGDPDHIEAHLVSYIKGFSANVRTIFDFFEFETEIDKMREANILYLVVSKFCDVDLHPNTVPNEQMGLIFENLIRRFNELASETAGDHFTPREVIRLMVNILFIQDDQLLATPGTVRKLLDPACGTGGMLAEAQNYLREHHSAARLYVYGQDYNKRAFATAASDMLMKQVDHNGGDNVRFGDSFTDDRFAGETFDDLSDVATILVPETEVESCLLKAGDVLMNGGGDADKLGRGCIWTGEIAPCLHQNHVFAVRPRLVRSEWLNAWTSTEVAKAFFESRAKQSTNLASISATNIKELPLPVPPVDEQRAIADYLDRETAQLDALVAAKERLIELLAEKCRALITRAVTRGLDPRAPLRDSGIPWLGEIPAHWETPPVYSRFEVQLGKMLDEKKIKGTHLAPSAPARRSEGKRCSPTLGRLLRLCQRAHPL